MDIESSPLCVYYLRVTLENSKPPIWRDILVPSDITLDVLHYVIQAVMGWDNNHLHQFIAGKVFYNDGIADAVHHDYESDVHDEDEHDRNEKKYTLSQLLTKEKTSIIYEYDLGDSWTHKIELKKILPADEDVHQPRCINGEQACPPEDCGGIWGYTDMLEAAIQNAKNVEKDEALTQFGDDFNPNYFDVDAVNKLLKQLFVKR